MNVIPEYQSDFCEKVKPLLYKVYNRNVIDYQDAITFSKHVTMREAFDFDISMPVYIAKHLQRFGK